MSKPQLKPEFESLQTALMETFLAGHHEYRPDLSYPQSHSDMTAGWMAVMRMFDIKRRPIALERKELLPETKP